MEPGLLPCWMAFAHARAITNVRKMEFLIEVVFNSGRELDKLMDEARAEDWATTLLQTVRRIRFQP